MQNKSPGNETAWRIAFNFGRRWRVFPASDHCTDCFSSSEALRDALWWPSRQDKTKQMLLTFGVLVSHWWDLNYFQKTTTFMYDDFIYIYGRRNKPNWENPELQKQDFIEINYFTDRLEIISQWKVISLNRAKDLR